MKVTKKFSVVIPVHNVAPFLCQCIHSVVTQTFTDFEIILVDDGSTDDSGIMCDEWAKKDARITVIHQKNQGVSSARNTGINVASGEYIIFLDSDDYWKDNSVLDRIASRLVMNGAEVLSLNYVKIDEEMCQKVYFRGIESMPVDTDVEDSFAYQINNGLWIACAWNKVIKRSLFAETDLQFRSGVTSEDIDWCVRLAFAAKSFDFLKDIIVCYRQRRTSISKSITTKKIETLFNNIDTSVLLLKGSSDTERAELLKSYVGYQYGTALYSIATLENKTERENMLKRAERQSYLFKWSQNRKIRMLRAVNQIGGLRLTVGLLTLLSKFR